MNAADVQPRPWTGRQWLAAVGWLVVLQVFLLALLSNHEKVRPRPEPVETRVQLVVPSTGESALTGGLGLSDPTLFALMNPNGFSGRAWLDFSLRQHRLNDWEEPPRWLSPDVFRFGAALTELVRTGRTDQLRINDKPAPQMPRVLVVDPIPTAKSTLTIEGELASRALVSPIEVPVWTNTDLLSNTVVQAAINAAGEMLSARLLSGCGSKAADQRALELAQQARFQAVPQTGPSQDRSAAALTWGRLIFQWSTGEVSTANPPPPVRPP